jgi:hypothetical protein
LAAFGLVCTSLTTLTPTHADAAASDVRLIAQSFNVPADGSLTATIELPPTLAGTDLSTSLIAVTVEQRVERREDLRPIISRSLERRDDTVAISPVCCPGPGPGQFTFSIPLETAEIRPDALSIPRAGLYPVTIAIQRDGRIVSTVLTFVNRLASPEEGTQAADAMSVAVAVGTHSSVHIDSKGTTSVDNQSTVTEMTQLADTLDALGASKFPATVRVAPEVLNALQVLQPALYTRLMSSLQQHQVIAEPEWPIDASQAAAAGQASLYTEWLRDGQQRLTALGLGPAVVTRSTIFVDEPIGADGAALRREQGADLMVMTPKIYKTLKGSIQDYSDYRGELIAADLPNNSELDTAVIDLNISDLLVHPLDTPELTRIYVVANLLALRQKLETEGSNVQRHSVVIGTPDLGVPDSTLIGSITALIAQTTGLVPATLDDVALRTDRLNIEGDDRPVTLPASDGSDLQKRVFRQANLENEINAVASMLPSDSEQPNDWRDLVSLLPTPAINDSDAAAMDKDVRDELAAVRDAVQVPTAYTVNLPGRLSTVRVRFVNTSATPLLIKVRLSSPSRKLVFANDPNPVLLAPGVNTVPIDVKALSNGTSGVTLDVFTPNDAPIGDPVALKFRVNALGVGNVLTVALFSLVVLWWLLHFRSTRRKRRQARAVAATLVHS